MNCLRITRLLQQRPRNIFKVLTAKYDFHNHPTKFIETENSWKQKDGVSKEWNLIYKAPMEKLLNYLTVYLTVTTGAFGCGGIYYGIFVFDKANLNVPVVIGDDVVIASNGYEYLTYLGAFVAFHVSVKVLLSNYVVRLYQNDDKYLAIFRGHMFNSIKKHEFHLEEFKKLKPSLVITWSDARFALGQKHGILLENYFKTPEHFNYLVYKRKADNLDDD